MLAMYVLQPGMIYSDKISDEPKCFVIVKIFNFLGLLNVSNNVSLLSNYSQKLILYPKMALCLVICYFDSTMGIYYVEDLSRDL
jgi:hypothetical protein